MQYNRRHSDHRWTLDNVEAHVLECNLRVLRRFLTAPTVEQVLCVMQNHADERGFLPSIPSGELAVAIFEAANPNFRYTSPFA